jgi:AcrR family transcriptional regulator
MSKPSKKIESQRRSIKISELAQISDVSKSTIHHYLNLGLLAPPKKMGLNRSVYDWTHLSTLRRIRELRENKKLPLAKIRDILAKESHHIESASQADDTASLISALEVEKRDAKAQKDEVKRIQIVDAAIALFSKNGYEKTTLEAIADSLHMAKSTVYLYFENKEDLFMECIDRLTVIAVPEKAWDDIRKETNFLKRLQKRGLAFHKAFPSYRGILTMTKAALGSNNTKLAEKAKNTLTLMTKPMKKDLRRGRAAGIFRDIDEEIVAYLFLAMGEGLGFRLMMDSKYTIEHSIEIMFDFVSRGLLKKPPQNRQSPDADICLADVKDIKGVKATLSKIRFKDKPYYPAKIGEADVKILFDKIKQATFMQKKSSFGAEITTLEGQVIWSKLDGGMILSGQVPLGDFSIELKNVNSIIFRAPES